MAFPWIRAVASAIAPLALAVATLHSASALAAKPADPCKTNAKSAECKAAKKKAAGNKAGSQAGASKNGSAAKKPASKTATGKTGGKTAGKTSKQAQKTSAAKSASGKKTSSKTRARAAAATTSAALAPAAASPAAEARALRSSTAYVQDLETSTVLFAKNENVVRPIASISKLMTALVVVDANQPMNEIIEITDEDVDTLKHTTSRLRVGTRLSRGDMLHLALMSSENRAAHALGRNYPGGLPAFVEAMNAKARSLGMLNTHFIEPTGLSSENVSSPHDLARLLRAAAQRPLIHRYSTDTEYEVEINKRTQTFRNTNLLVRKPDWDIKVSKTGFINEAGECLVMLARINGRDMAIVLLDSQGKLSRIGDAVRIRRIVQSDVAML
ncbi:D-alanyl-D-alanine endopeptidase [Bordetella hinzii]|uniref:Class A beta-lactamase n=1 Tax=Bordetella hinzii OH87 BAL007II TaxID=1331262 RepID=A0ABR4R242_9BORD|nr:D-alanyl-D-alanine endopeptidase [Bordetella hinzii]KCB24819.1 class A beta-lactamase [Bordetella hinzii OH87 BAL007II]KCB44284.1 class A beta-lactamase [Bordetella hinzii 5132]QDJ30895.1 D-alanyl-D-alanine endopeptidase [Bordetella hinzii]QDJ39877.1 D-alanyl-D-alanine endopeptidase [Bordetella hinzii]QDJ53410.1 D-alanyl-D-alanine endopeptidase [Bordetella hinzii]